MQNYIHSLGSFGKGLVSGDSGELRIVCRDGGAITRIFRGQTQAERSPLGRGWSISLPCEGNGKMHFTDGKLTEFSDVRGESYGFFYYGGMLECISTPKGMLFYDYNADGMLTTVGYPDGRRAYISYCDVYRLQDICLRGSDGRGSFAVSYVYGMDGNVEYVYEYGYNGGERVERRFTDLSDRINILTLAGGN